MKSSTEVRIHRPHNDDGLYVYGVGAGEFRMTLVRTNSPALRAKSEPAQNRLRLAPSEGRLAVAVDALANDPAQDRTVRVLLDYSLGTTCTRSCADGSEGRWESCVCPCAGLFHGSGALDREVSLGAGLRRLPDNRRRVVVVRHGEKYAEALASLLRYEAAVAHGPVPLAG